MSSTTTTASTETGEDVVGGTHLELQETSSEESPCGDTTATQEVGFESESVRVWGM